MAPTRLAAPSLIAPEEGQRFTNFPRTMSLAWHEVAGATHYEVEVDAAPPDGATWRPLVRQSGVHATSFVFDFTGPQPGRWRVAAFDETGAHLPSPPSDWRRFDYAPVPVLATPAPLEPADGQHFDNLPRRTTLAWRGVAGATHYQVEVEYAVSGATRLEWRAAGVGPVEGTRVGFDFVGPHPGRWRVTALDHTGAHLASTPSEWRNFIYTV